MPPTFRALRLLVAVSAASVLAGAVEARAADWPAGMAHAFDQSMSLAIDAGRRFVRWVEASYAINPAVTIGLGGALLLPTLVLAGGLLYRRRTPTAKTREPIPAGIPDVSSPRLVPDGAPAIALPRGRDLVQIGRHEDNDICIEDASVERYHAVIARSQDEGFTITDVSGLDGEGVRINGAPCVSAVLSHGDTVELGNARMRFQTAL